MERQYEHICESIVCGPVCHERADLQWVTTHKLLDFGVDPIPISIHFSTFLNITIFIF